MNENLRWKCKFCNNEISFRTRKLLYEHKRTMHPNSIKSPGHHFDNDYVTCYCKFCKREFTRKSSRSFHQRRCKKNPNAIKPVRHKHSEDSKLKISKAMKLAHKEGRAHNIGQERWKHEPSYPEKFFMNVIKNNFDDKNYVREYTFHIYSLDFAWVNKKLCIEIDGEQHKKKRQSESDKRKDLKLRSEGWEILRIKWKDLFNNPEYYINLANNFIGK